MRVARAIIAIAIGFLLGMIVTGAEDPIPRTTPVRGEDYNKIAQEYTKGWEQLRLKAYKDNTRYSIGYGNESYQGEEITEKEADRRFYAYWDANIPPLKKYTSSKGQYVALADTLYNKGGKVDRFLSQGKIDCEKIGKMDSINAKYYAGVKNRRVLNYKLCTGEIEWHESLKRDIK